MPLNLFIPDSDDLRAAAHNLLVAQREYVAANNARCATKGTDEITALLVEEAAMARLGKARNAFDAAQKVAA